MHRVNQAKKQKIPKEKNYTILKINKKRKNSINNLIKKRRLYTIFTIKKISVQIIHCFILLINIGIKLDLYNALKHDSLPWSPNFHKTILIQLKIERSISQSLIIS